MIRSILYSLIILLAAVLPAEKSRAEGIVSAVVSAPIFANGTVRDIRSGTNIYLQNQSVKGLDFMDPAVTGYGIPAGGRMEVEMVSGFQRDPQVPLDQEAILLVAGAPQQGLPAKAAGYQVREGDNQNTFVIEPEYADGMAAQNLVSPAPGAALDPIRQRGIKIIHVGRRMAFVSRGETGRVEVRIFDKDNRVINAGSAEIKFLPEPVPQVFPTNIPHKQRNHNWQRIGPNQIVGADANTLPLPVLLFEKNEAMGNVGIEKAGVLSTAQLEGLGYRIPDRFQRFDGGLILKDTDGDGRLLPGKDVVIGGLSVDAPSGATGHQAVTPLVGERPFLSVPTGRFNETAGRNIGGAIMQVVFVAGNKKGLYRLTFSLLKRAGDLQSPDGSSVTYTVVVQ